MYFMKIVEYSQIRLIVAAFKVTAPRDHYPFTLGLKRAFWRGQSGLTFFHGRFTAIKPY